MHYKDKIEATQKRGFPHPLGVSKKAEGVNFALFSQHAYSVTLHLFRPAEQNPFMSFPLNPLTNKTGWVWHICLGDLHSTELEYAYQIQGNNKEPCNRFEPDLLLSDPYAISLNTSRLWGERDLSDVAFIPKGKIILDDPFDWEEDLPPHIPLSELIIYELHVRGFTIDPFSQTKHPGTFLGLIEKIPYLKSLGINAVELMPIFEFNEREIKRVNPQTGELLKNVWGYSTINFFTPMNRFCSSDSWNSSIHEFKTLVKEMHKQGIEVYLDVVYNHTAEGNEEGPTFSFKGIDNQVYYLLTPEGQYLNFSGTGNTFNANHPVAAQLILNSLRYWVEEMHVDGFRFDLASCLTRDTNGIPDPWPLLIQMITNDPVLGSVKLIAEPWDATGLYQVGYFPGGARWMEWNGQYRDTVRRFIKGDENGVGFFTRALCGSEELYGQGMTPCRSINFITVHDGFTLYDLVSYENKHNLANAENNNDGSSSNDSWNCGAEGETENLLITTLRKRQMRNFHVALLVSSGTPLLFMGDEYGHTKGGNNNTYCQDNKTNWFLWNRLKEDEGWHRFYRNMIHFRKNHALLKRTQFLTDQEIRWHGLTPLQANWSGSNRFIAYTLIDTDHSLYIAFNADSKGVTFQLPQLSEFKNWYRVVDTSLPSPEDFIEEPQDYPSLPPIYSIPAYTAFIAKAL